MAKWTNRQRLGDDLLEFATNPDVSRVTPICRPRFAAAGAFQGYNDGFWGIPRLRAPRPSN
jgi:hypothetical protein